MSTNSRHNKVIPQRIKNVKSTSVSLTCVNNTTGGSNKISNKKQKETLPSTEKEETDIPLKESVTKTTREKYIKNISNENMSN